MPQVRRKRRVNIENKAKAADSIENLNKIAERMAAIRAEKERLDAEEAELGTEAAGLMQYLKIDELKVPGCGTHTYAPTKKNSKNVVDPKAFMAAVGENAFYSCVTVPIGEAKKHLGEKELSQITEHTPGGEGPTVYKFK